MFRRNSHNMVTEAVQLVDYMEWDWGSIPATSTIFDI